MQRDGNSLAPCWTHEVTGQLPALIPSRELQKHNMSFLVSNDHTPKRPQDGDTFQKTIFINWVPGHSPKGTLVFLSLQWGGGGKEIKKKKKNLCQS